TDCTLKGMPSGKPPPEGMRRNITRRWGRRVVNSQIKGDEPKQKWEWNWRSRRTG
ncbi:hypothetical protein MKW92_045579, partial [Papaver armeniacum]